MSIEIVTFDRRLLSASAELRRWFSVTKGNKRLLRIGTMPEMLLPESFLKSPQHPVELMLIALMEGAWISADDWKPYARLTIASRLKRKRALIFHDTFAEMQEPVMDYQLHGGTFKEQQRIQKFAKHILTLRTPDVYLQGCARLCLSIASENQITACVHPLHWIRAVIATQDFQPAFGMAALQVEMMDQKKTLCRLIRTELPENI